MADMFRIKAIGAFVLTLFSLWVGAASGQENKECPSPVYASQEVTRPAKIVERLYLGGVREPIREFNGRVKLEAVLCRTGRVTDIRITEGSSPLVNDFVSAAASLTRFVPAELNWHTVSQRIQLEFEIVNGDVKEITVPQTKVRLVESVNVLGNRRLTAQQILGWVRTRAGEPYDEAQVKRDFDAILATRNFDKLSTRVFIEDGERGGVGVFFEIHELPVVGVVNFEGLKIDPAVVRQAWKAAQIDLQTGAPYWPEAGKMAIHVIKQVLDSKALNYSKVELRAEMSGGQTVNLTFVITNQ
jgi:hypothetical protein